MMQEVQIDVEEYITRFEEINNLVTQSNHDIVETEGLESAEQVLSYIKTSIKQIAAMSLRELKKKQGEAQINASPEVMQDIPRKPGRYMGVAGSYDDYQ